MIKTKFRVEVNHGSKYFTNGAEAFAYFNKKCLRCMRVEIWLCTYEITPKLFSAKQELLDSFLCIGAS